MGGAGEQRILALSSMVLPALALGLLWPGAFLVALDYSGTLRLLLFAVLPVLMVWRLRYRHHLEPWLPGGRPLLAAMLAVAAGSSASSYAPSWASPAAPRRLLASVSPSPAALSCTSPTSRQEEPLQI